MHLNQPQKTVSDDVGGNRRESISVIALAILNRWMIKKSNKLQLWKVFFLNPKKPSAASFLFIFFSSALDCRENLPT